MMAVKEGSPEVDRRDATAGDKETEGSAVPLRAAA
jgi:hypothetical protein